MVGRVSLKQRDHPASERSPNARTRAAPAASSRASTDPRRLVHDPADGRVDDLRQQHLEPRSSAAPRAAPPSPSPSRAARTRRSRARARRRASPPGRDPRAPPRRPPPRSAPAACARGVVPRTACPRLTSSRASIWPRHPQPMIRQRANARLSCPSPACPRTPRAPARGVRSGRPRARRRALVASSSWSSSGRRDTPRAVAAARGRRLRDAQLEVADADLGLAARAPPGVVRGEHLLEVLGLERLARLGDLAGRPAAQPAPARARVEPADQPHRHDDDGDAAEDHDRERVHRSGKSNPAWRTGKRLIAATSIAGACFCRPSKSLRRGREPASLGGARSYL